MNTETALERFSASVVTSLYVSVLMHNARRGIHWIVFNLNDELETARLTLRFAFVVFVAPGRFVFMLALWAFNHGLSLRIQSLSESDARSDVPILPTTTEYLFRQGSG